MSSSGDAWIYLIPGCIVIASLLCGCAIGAHSLLVEYRRYGLNRLRARWRALWGTRRPRGNQEDAHDVELQRLEEASVDRDEGLPQSLENLSVLGYIPRMSSATVSAPDEICPICLEDYSHDDRVRRLSCGHQFHRSCITHWLHLDMSCPMCKRKQPLLTDAQKRYLLADVGGATRLRLLGIDSASDLASRVRDDHSGTISATVNSEQASARDAPSAEVQPRILPTDALEAATESVVDNQQESPSSDSADPLSTLHLVLPIPGENSHASGGGHRQSGLVHLQAPLDAATL